MAPSPSKWILHLQILGVLGAVVAFVVTLLLSTRSSRPLDGIAEALIAGGLIVGIALHAFVSTLVVVFGGRDRVAGAHVVSAAALAMALLFQCR